MSAILTIQEILLVYKIDVLTEQVIGIQTEYMKLITAK